jgi:hypothetical protein
MSEAKRDDETWPAASAAPEDEGKLAELLAEFADVTDRRQRAFLAGFVLGKGVRGAQRLSGVHRRSHYQWLEDDAVYAERFALVQRMLADEAEEEAYRRAFVGYETSISWRGEVRSAHKGYSDALAIFLLRGMKPERYRRRAGEPDSGQPATLHITIRRHGDGAEKPAEAPEPPRISIPLNEPEE